MLSLLTLWGMAMPPPPAEPPAGLIAHAHGGLKFNSVKDPILGILTATHPFASLRMGWTQPKEVPSQ
eukprot:COSAG01_NODE_228_length_21104_cov_210.303832_27_plen_67_part_00